MLGPITRVTATTPDLAATQSGYTGELGYVVAGSGTVSEQEARAWGTPASAGAEWLLLHPCGQTDFTFRFIHRAPEAAFVPMQSFGWSAAEVVVADVDELGKQLATSSHFSTIGEPMNLSFTDDIRAMQVSGPGGEILYLTQITGEVPGMDLPKARCPVDRTFIVILGAPDIHKLRQYYQATFGIPETPVISSRARVVSRAFQLPPDTEYPISAMPLAGQSLIEVDEFPKQAIERPGDRDLLPPGISIVTFLVDEFPADACPTKLQCDAYRGQETAWLRGPVGEIIELTRPVET